MPIARDFSEFYEMTRLGVGAVRTPDYKILVEGDSWVSHPLLTNLTTQFDILGKDDFGILSLADPGDTAVEMFKKEGRRYVGQAKRFDQAVYNERFGEKWDLIFISAGGNDIVGPEIAEFVNDYVEGGPSGADLINREFDRTLKSIVKAYKTMLEIRRRSRVNKQTPIALHVYGYLEPRKVGTKVLGALLGKGWVKRYLDPKGIPQEDQREIIAAMLTRFRDALMKLAENHENVYVIDTLKVLYKSGQPDLDLWHDEIHPTGEGFRKIAMKIKRDLSQQGSWPGA